MRAVQGVVCLQRVHRAHLLEKDGVASVPQQFRGLNPAKCYSCGSVNHTFQTSEKAVDGVANTTSWHVLTIGNTLWAASKLFASFGGHSDYHLCEGLKHEHWLTGLGAEGDLLAAGALPSVKGSRQMITCELATFVILNRKGCLRYIRSVSGNKKLVDSKVQDANQLIKCAKAGLSDLLVVSGMLARSLFFVCIGSMARFVLNHFGSRPTLRAVMDIVLETSRVYIKKSGRNSAAILKTFAFLVYLVLIENTQKY